MNWVCCILVLLSLVLFRLQAIPCVKLAMFGNYEHVARAVDLGHTKVFYRILFV